MKPHPYAFTEEERHFIERLRSMPAILRSEDYERLAELLGRWPTYEEGDDGELDADKPITLNQRFQDGQLAAKGYENVLLFGRPFIRGEEAKDDRKAADPGANPARPGS